MDELIDTLTARRPDVSVALAADRISAMPGALSATTPCKLLFRLPDPFDYASFGVRPGDPRRWPPGRAFDAATGLEVQVARSTLPDVIPPPGPGPRPDPIAVLARDLRLADLKSPRHRNPSGDRLVLPLGQLDEPRSTATIDLGPGDHLLVAGPDGSGRSTTLATLAATAAAGAEVLVSGPPRSALAGHAATRDRWVPLDRLHHEVQRCGGRRTLVLLDDADLLDDRSGMLAGLLDRDPDVHVAVAAHAGRLRASYGHWTSPLRLARLGLALCPGPYDGELWATTLRPIGGAPGRGQLVCHGRPTLVQVARP
jgi:S-DNA-T family DNA segregation ATPase FtsK/SpoIIIE